MKDKKALVFGGSSYIGSMITKKLAFGDHVVHDTYFDHSERCIYGLGKDIVHHHCDIRDLNQVHDLIKEVGELDVLVTAAFPWCASDNFDFQGGYLLAEKFLRGHVFAICEVIKIMRKGGKIINILGQCVDKGLPGGAFYSASYAFLHNLSMSINAREGREGKIFSYDLLLGLVSTPAWESLPEEVLQPYREKMFEFIEPAAVADVVKFIVDSRVGPTKFKLDAFYSL